MPLKFTYIVAILEGAIIIACELGLGHLITPYYGTSIQVWSTTIISTMLGMSVGYLLSVFYLQEKSISSTILFYSYYSLFISLLALYQKEILQFTLNFDYSTGLILINFIFIFLNIVAFSALLPTLINKISSNSNDVAINTGNIYFYSTLSSIIVSLAFGFYLFEQFGVQQSVIMLTIMSSTVLFGVYNFQFKFKTLHLVGVASLIVLIIINLEKKGVKDEIYSSDGLLGKLIVQDFSSGNNEGRRLFLNGSVQTMIYKQTGESYGQYPYLIRSLLHKSHTSNKNALLLGLGGGTIAFELKNNGYNVTGVELDPRISYTASKYFYPNISFKSVVMDGRFFINKSQDKYGCIVLDVFKSENPPFQLLSYQALKRIYQLLDENGVLLINFNGFWTGKSGFASKALLKTLLKAGYSVNLYPTQQPEDNRNMVFYATKQPLNMNRTVPFMNGLVSTAVNYTKSDLKYVPILDDDKPILPILNLKAASTWRKYGIEFLQHEGI